MAVPRLHGYHDPVPPAPHTATVVIIGTTTGFCRKTRASSVTPLLEYFIDADTSLNYI